VSSINQPLGIDQCNCFASRKAARRITRFYDVHLEPAGLRITQFLTLAALSEAGSVAVNALAERLDIERTAMGKMLGFLERDRLIAIHPSPVDGRSRLVGLTEKGRRRHAEASPLWLEAQRCFEQSNGKEKVATLRQRLADIAFGDAAAARV
jgi:DNA-binding MarR family transcriptional regulator